MRLFNKLAYTFGSYAFSLFAQKNNSKIKDSVLTIEDVKFSIRPHTNDVYSVWEIYGRKEYNKFQFNIKPSDVIIDIGAHIGTFSVYAAKKVLSGKVFSYEAHPDNFARLARNKELNNLSNLYINNIAIASEIGSRNFYLSQHNTGGHSIYEVDSNQSITVPTTTLEEIFIKNRLSRINLLKIDVEGAEYDIILNTPREILAKIDKIILEYHDYLVKGKSCSDLTEYLESCGFKVMRSGPILQRIFYKMGILYASNNY